jgi:two-component system, chemotaxis family, response regulator WspF
VRIGIINERRRETEVLLQAVALKPEHHVIWIGKSGADAVELCARETPDLILIDLLAGLDGVDATRRIMASAPCAILIVTGSLHINGATVFEAIGHGALDVVEMPASSTRTLQESAAPLLVKLATISRLIGERDAARRALAFCSTPRL